MGEYFSGWRRKIGVLTLVMACVFMGAWLRNQDGVSFASGEQRRFGLFVSDGFFILSTPKNADSTNQDFVIWESNDSGFIKQLGEKSLVK